MSQFRRHIPNLVSCSRIVLAALFPLFSTPGWIVILVLAALSDILDGMVARRLGVQSPYGNIVDPAADKIFIFAIFLTFLAQGAIGPWELVAIALRDLAVVGGALALLVVGKKRVLSRLNSRIPGKVTTVMQFAVLMVLLLWQQTIFALVLATSLVSFAAGVDYLIDYYRRALTAKKKSQHSAIYEARESTS